MAEQDGSRMIMVAATREELENIPEYKTLEEKQAEADAAAAQQQTQPPGTTGATGTGVAPAPTPAPAAQPSSQ